ncbi:hypothetical protein [Granulicella sp. L60]|uniref:hypothetical protein n=1 Tax=Granulicella sp. L60 TaxID=1641866 RepID=UPI00131D5E3E|nr:hypothetical protein [Granulicella sp. L60]
MRNAFRACLLACLFLTACKSSDKPSNENFAKAIDAYLAKHGKLCASIGRPFPVDISASTLKDQSGTGPQMAALEQAGLVYSSDATAVSPGILGGATQHPVKRYEVSDQGKTYFQELPGVFGKTGSFCYGEKAVDAVVTSSAPQTTAGSKQAEVTYTYKVLNIAPWAERPEIQRVFGDIRTTLAGASKVNETTGLQLTDQGWVVPGQP